MRYRYAFPQPGELVICRVTNIQRGYVQVVLEDYSGLAREDNAQGMIHISELSNRWVKNINSLVSINQRLVLQVLRVNEDRGYLDLSLRRVNKNQKSAKMNQWRYNQKLEGLMKFFAEKHNMPLDQMYEVALFPIMEKYGDLRSAFEEIKEEGKDLLVNIPDINLPEDVMEDLYQSIIENISIPTVEIVAEFEIRSFEGNGIELIKEAISNADKIRKKKGVDASFTYIGAPIYRCLITAKDYPTAEKLLEKITAKIEEKMIGRGSVEVNRDQLSNDQEA